MAKANKEQDVFNEEENNEEIGFTNQEETTEEAPKETKKEATTEGEKSVDQLVKEVVAGLHGTGRERMMSLGDKYEEVQHEVNQLIKKGEI